jgi:hypothetical protein
MGPIAPLGDDRKNLSDIRRPKRSLWTSRSRRMSDSSNTMVRSSLPQRYWQPPT